MDVPYTVTVRRPGPFTDKFKLFLDIGGELREMVVTVAGTAKQP